MTFAVDAALRSAAILALALAAAGLLRRRSAALRHCVLAAGLLGALAVVPLAALLPVWEIRIAESGVTPGARGAIVTERSTGTTPMPQTRTVQDLMPSRAVVSAAWGTGSLWFGGILLTGLAGLRRLSRRAAPVEHQRWVETAHDLSATFGLRRTVRVLQADRDAPLATWGFRRPLILIPTAAGEWTPSRVRAVLAHELAHVSRGDWCVQIAAEVVRALFWFNPLTWMLCARLRRESEHACDDVVLALGIRSDEYATHLLDLARAIRSPLWASAMLMARPSTLERRIAAMLNPLVARRAVSGRIVGLIAVALLAVVLPTAALRAVQNAPLTYSGSVFDSSGAVLPGVTVTLTDEREVPRVSVTDAHGVFEFSSVGPGKYVLETDLPGFRPLRHAFDLQEAGDRQRDITLQVGTLTETVKVTGQRTRAPRPVTAAIPVVRVGGNIRVPNKLKDVRPVYPKSMSDAGAEGIVRMEALIGLDGHVVSARVLSAQVHPDFARAAITAVQQWVFTQTLLNGVPVEVAMNVTIDFSISN